MARRKLMGEVLCDTILQLLDLAQIGRFARITGAIHDDCIHACRLMRLVRAPIFTDWHPCVIERLAALPFCQGARVLCEQLTMVAFIRCAFRRTKFVRLNLGGPVQDCPPKRFGFNLTSAMATLLIFRPVLSILTAPRLWRFLKMQCERVQSVCRIGAGYLSATICQQSWHAKRAAIWGCKTL